MSKKMSDTAPLEFRKLVIQLLNTHSRTAAIELAAKQCNIEIQPNWIKYTPSYIHTWRKQVGDVGSSADTQSNKTESNTQTTSAPKQRRTKSGSADLQLMVLAVQYKDNDGLSALQAITKAIEQCKAVANPSWLKNPASYIHAWRGASNVAPRSAADAAQSKAQRIAKAKQTKLANKLERQKQQKLDASIEWWNRSKVEYNLIDVADARPGDYVQYFDFSPGAKPGGHLCMRIMEVNKYTFKGYRGPYLFANNKNVVSCHKESVYGVLRPQGAAGNEVTEFVAVEVTEVVDD